MMPSTAADDEWSEVVAHYAATVVANTDPALAWYFENHPYDIDKRRIDYYSTSTVQEFKDNIMETDAETIASWLIKYIDFNKILEDKWNADKIAIIHHDERYTRLEKIGDTYPIWNNDEWRFFTEHPDKSMFTIIYLPH
jgi:hypothetical protein